MKIEYPSCRIMTKAELQELIKSAFVGVTLDGGSSLLQCQAMDKRCDNITAEEYEKLPLQEITDNWRLIPTTFLERYCQLLAHADEKAFRYYMPAMMRSSISGSCEVLTETLFYLRPSKEHLEHSMKHYSLFDDTQRSAIAQFLRKPLKMPRCLRRGWMSELSTGSMPVGS